MLPYISGFSHAVLLLCSLFLWLNLSMEETGKYGGSQRPPPYALVIEDDCYIPNSLGSSFEILPVNMQSIEHHFEGMAP